MQKCCWMQQAHAGLSWHEVYLGEPAMQRAERPRKSAGLRIITLVRLPNS